MLFESHGSPTNSMIIFNGVDTYDLIYGWLIWVENIKIERNLSQKRKTGRLCAFDVPNSNFFFNNYHLLRI